jgi:hypothetical protein
LEAWDKENEVPSMHDKAENSVAEKASNDSFNFNKHS